MTDNILFSAGRLNLKLFDYKVSVKAVYRMDKVGFSAADILLPKHVDMTRWSVIACDQYTSQPDYWERAAQMVGSSPSTLHLVLPEVYLEQDDVGRRITQINASMRAYLCLLYTSKPV